MTVDALRDGRWLTAARVKACALLLLAGYGVGLFWMFSTADGLMSRSGRSLGSDFAALWTSGLLVLDGRAAAVFDLDVLRSTQQALFGVSGTGFPHSPLFLAVAAVLAVFPYLTALLGFVAITLSLYLGAIERIFEGSGVRVSTIYLVAAASPAVFACIYQGQSGLLGAALLGGGLALLPTRPALAGCLIGLLAFQPPLVLLCLVALMAIGAWRALSGALAVIALTTGASLVLFGAKTWVAYLAAATSMAGSINLTIFAILSAVVIWLWRSPASYAQKAAGLIIAGTLVMQCDYGNAAIVVPALAFLVVDGLKRGFAPFEKSLLALIWVTPLFGILTDLPIDTWVQVATLLALIHKVGITNARRDALPISAVSAS